MSGFPSDTAELPNSMPILYADAGPVFLFQHAEEFGNAVLAFLRQEAASAAHRMPGPPARPTNGGHPHEVHDHQLVRAARRTT